MPPSWVISLPCRQQVAGVRAGAVEPETATATATGRERVMAVTTLNPRFGDAPPSPPAGNGSDLLRIWTSGPAPSPRRYPTRADAASASSPVRPPSPQPAATAAAAAATAAAPVAAAPVAAAPLLVLVTALVIAGATTTAAAAADIAAATAVIAAGGAVVIVAAVVLCLRLDTDVVHSLDSCASLVLPATSSSGASTPVEDVVAMEVEKPLASPLASPAWTVLSPMEVSPDFSAVTSATRLRVLTPMDVDT